MPPTAEQLLAELKKLIERLPLYSNTSDWEKAKEYFYSRIGGCRKQVDEFRAKVEAFEKRVSVVSDDVVKLENA